MLVIPLIAFATGTPTEPQWCAPGTPVDISETEALALIARGFAKASKVASATSNDLLDALVDAMADLPAEAFGKDGRPTVKALEAVLGEAVSAGLRDKAWEAYQRLLGDDKRSGQTHG